MIGHRAQAFPALTVAPGGADPAAAGAVLPAGARADAAAGADLAAGGAAEAGGGGGGRAGRGGGGRGAGRLLQHHDAVVVGLAVGQWGYRVQP